MRVTDRAMFDNAAAAVAAARTRHERATTQAGTGVALRHPWDGPEAAHAARERYDTIRARSFATAAERALDEVVAADGALGAVVDAVTDALELAVQMANATMSSVERTAAAGEVKGILVDVVRAMNSEIAGRFLFAGTADGIAPFDATGNYLGDSGARGIEVAPGVTETVSVRGDVAIKGAAGGVDVTAELAALQAALVNNDVIGIRAGIDWMNAAVRQVAAVRADVGGIELALIAAGHSADALADGAESRRADLTDADMADAAIELALAERALEAATAVAARSMQITLLDKL